MEGEARASEDGISHPPKAHTIRLPSHCDHFIQPHVCVGVYVHVGVAVTGVKGVGWSCGPIHS